MYDPRMGIVVSLARRSLWLVLFGAVGGGAYSWWRDRSAPNPPGPAEWPPMTANSAAATSPSSTTTKKAPSPPSSTADTSDGSPNSNSNTAARASIVNALVDAPEARSSAESGNWVLPLDDGSCPATHPIKANDNSGIFHVPDGRFYVRTKAERCYTTAEAALADGYRQAKN
jgi:hypothetical protein